MEFQYCPKCGAPLVVGPVAGKDREHCPECGFVAFHNPAPVGLAVIEHRGRLVLIRRLEAPLAGYWAPPGGYVEIGESVPEAVIREAREECGLTIALDGLAGVYSHAEVEVVLVAFRAHSTAGGPLAGDDAGAVGVFDRGDVPAEPPPPGGTTTDLWLHAVIRELLLPWERPAPR
jgi:ADP-ribose pyrophosphatase YjhB (NUDIX family)